MNYKRQYNLIGKKYLFGQKNFYSTNKDEAIVKMLELMGNLHNKTILDVGCGGGKDILVYEKLGVKNVYGLDASAIMVKEAKKLVKKPENIYLGDMSKNVFKKNFFDIIVGRFSLHYLKNFKTVYSEFNRLLKKDGFIVLAVAHPLRDFILKKNKKYYSQEKIKIKVYENQTSLYFPTHTFSDYFSKDFFNHFQIVDFYEQKKMKKRKFGLEVPSFFIYKAIKK